MAKKIYVGNLSFQTSENELSDLFAQFGEVESVSIITDRDTGRSKGFGFVEMSEENADKAISGLSGTELNGRALTVNEARPMVKRDFGGGGGGGGGRGGRGGYGRY
jgi:cold-inducible RNA-binding protein